MSYSLWRCSVFKSRPLRQHTSRLTTSGSLRLGFLIPTPERSEVSLPPRETDLRLHLHFCLNPHPYPSGCYARFVCVPNSWYDLISLDLYTSSITFYYHHRRWKLPSHFNTYTEDLSSHIRPQL